jgi:hypothetical protein
LFGFSAARSTRLPPMLVQSHARFIPDFLRTDDRPVHPAYRLKPGVTRACR